MGKLCIEKSSGRFRDWVRNGLPATYDPLTHDLLDADAPPADGMRWDGTAWVPLPPKTNAEKDGELQAALDAGEGPLLRALIAALIKKGALTLADVRTEYRSLT